MKSVINIDPATSKSIDEQLADIRYEIGVLHKRCSQLDGSFCEPAAHDCVACAHAWPSHVLNAGCSVPACGCNRSEFETLTA